MQHSSSLELSKELYELSGWTSRPQDRSEIHNAWRPTPITSLDDYRLINIGPNTPEDIPAYSAGYLLRRLPETVDEFYDFYLTKTGAFYGDLSEMTGHDSRYWVDANTPEDVLAKLAIELFKSGVLTREVQE